jgi:light-regulated signal transduction histidine kinase (bacteriophytochrome)
MPVGQRACETEPIRVPGAIQPHGLLLTFDPDSEEVLQWAGDFARLLGSEPEPGKLAEKLLGRSLAELLCKRLLIAGEEALSVGRINPADRQPLNVMAHRSGRVIVLELEPVGPELSSSEALEVVRSVSDAMGAMPSVADACECAAVQVRSITGFDRVMIYRFLEDGSGSVIAESAAPGVRSFRNHRFPATDIPQQARELYLSNLIRVIPNASYKPLPLQPSAGKTLDMSQCVLRSVSPVHLQYLRNMGVAASMSVSIVIDGKLWGLIACHHSAASCVPVEAQLLCRHVGQVLAASIRGCVEAENAQLSGLHSSALEDLLTILQSSEDPERTLRSSASSLAELVDCSGVALIVGQQPVAQAGRLPREDVLARLGPLVESRLNGTDSFWTDRPGEEIPQVAEAAAEASGVLAVRTGSPEPLHLLWFRRELAQEVLWAGDPTDKQAAADAGQPLTPR